MAVVGEMAPSEREQQVEVKIRVKKKHLRIIGEYAIFLGLEVQDFLGDVLLTGLQVRLNFLADFLDGINWDKLRKVVFVDEC